MRRETILIVSIILLSMLYVGQHHTFPTNTAFGMKQREYEGIRIYSLGSGTLRNMNTIYVRGIQKNPYPQYGIRGYSESKIAAQQQPPPSGDWIINSPVEVINETLIINGSIIIVSGGRLTLVNSTLIMNVTYNGEHNITVRGGSRLSLYSSNITSINTNYRYYIYVAPGAVFGSNNSLIGYAGYDDDHPGVLIETRDVAIYDTNFTNCYIPIYLNNTYNVTINGSTIAGDYVGVWIENTTRVVMKYSKLAGGEECLYIYNSSNIRIEGCAVGDSPNTNIEIRNSTDILLVDISSKNYAKANTVTKNIDIYGSANITIENSTIAVSNQQKAGAKQYGILINESSDVKVARSLIKGYVKQSTQTSGASIYQYVTYVAHSANIVLSNNTVSCTTTLVISSYTQDVYQYGIYISSAQHVLVNTTSITNGFTVQGIWGSQPDLYTYGCYVVDSANITIRNSSLSTNFGASTGFISPRIHGCLLQMLRISDSSSIYNTFIGSKEWGYTVIKMNSCINITMAHQRIEESRNGIIVSSSSSITLLYSNITDCGTGIKITNSNRTRIRGGALESSLTDVLIEYSREIALSEVLILGTSSGVKIRYSAYVNTSSVVINGAARGICVEYSNNTLVTGCWVLTEDYGVEILFSNDTLIQHTNVTICEISIHIENATNITLLDSIISDSIWGVKLEYSTNIIWNNTYFYNTTIYIEDKETFANIQIFDSLFNDGPILLIYDTAITISGDYGAILVGYSNITIHDTEASYIFLKNCSRIELMDLTMPSNAIGIYMDMSTNARIVDVDFIGINNIGIFISQATNVSMININDQGEADILIGVYDSRGVLIDEVYSTGSYGILLDSCQNILINDSVILNADHAVEADRCINITIILLWVADCSYGILLDYSENITIMNSSFYGCDYGVYASNSSPVLLGYNTFHNCMVGTYVRGSNSLAIIQYNIVDNCVNGIAIAFKANATIQYNVLENNTYGIKLGAITSLGMPPYTDRVYAVIYGNAITNNDVAIYALVQDGNITILNNNISFNCVGVYIEDIPYPANTIILILFNLITHNEEYSLVLYEGIVSIYGNAFIANSSSVNRIYVDANASCQFSYDYFGNYWSQHTNIDDDQDGIADQPYRVCDGYWDQYPLALPPTILGPKYLVCGIHNETYTNMDIIVYVFVAYPDVTVGFLVDSDTETNITTHPYRFLIDISSLSQSRHYLRINIYTNNVLTLKIVFYVDTESPEIVVDFVNESWISGQIAINISLIDNLALQMAKIYIDGSLNATYSFDGTNKTSIILILDSTAYVDGEHVLVIVTMDRAGNTNELTLRFYVDNTPPEVQILPQNNTYASGLLGINITISENMDLSHIEVYIDGVLEANITAQGITNITVQIDTEKYGDGLHEIEIMVYDLAGNIARGTLHILFDNTQPSINNIVYPENITSDADHVTIYIDASDNTEISRVIVTYSYDNRDWINITAGVVNNTYYASIPVRGDIENITFRVIVIDIAGNKAITKTYTINIVPRKELTTTIERTTTIYRTPGAILGLILVLIITMITIGIIILRRKKGYVPTPEG